MINITILQKRKLSPKVGIQLLVTQTPALHKAFRPHLPTVWEEEEKRAQPPTCHR